MEVRILQRVLSARRSANWVYPLIGLAYEVPFADTWRFTLRGDFGGFGIIGSEFTWHALTRLTYQVSDRVSCYVGYRVNAYDFEEGDGRNFQKFDLRQHGPGPGVAVHF
jgi:hypothetical protein